MLCAIDVFAKYAWVKPLKDKKAKTVLKAFIETVNESNRKPNKLWVDQGKIILQQTYPRMVRQQWYFNVLHA